VYKNPANTLFMGKKLVYMPECHSTNTLALELSQKQDWSEGAVLITNHQTKGRGQQGNVWISEIGKNLTFSVVLKPTFLPIKDQFLLNMIASLAVKDVVQSKVAEKVSVKWPNDILIKDLKVCGILIENQIQGTTFTKSIIGIGMNINQKGFHQNRATSLTLQSGIEYCLQDLLEEVLSSLEKWYILLRQNGTHRVKNSYHASMYGINEIRNFRSDDGDFEGSIQGVDDYGRLVIKKGKEVLHFNTKEVQFDFEPFK